MTKKWLVLLTTTALLSGAASSVLAKPLEGVVTALDNTKVTIELSAADAKKLSLADTLELKVIKKDKKNKKAPQAASDALTGC